MRMLPYRRQKEDIKDMAWYVMRDLTRSNALMPSWKLLEADGYEVYTPMVWKVVKRGIKRTRERVPVIHDLLFVKSSREALDPVVSRIPTLQYRFVRGAYGKAMEVSEEDMERFIRATRSTDDVLYYKPSELTPAMVGKRVMILGGPLDGMIGNLLSIKGMRKRRLLVELPDTLISAVDVSPQYIKIIE